MDAHELAEKMRSAFKSKQVTGELFQEITEWCKSHTGEMDLSNDDHSYLYTHATNYLMKHNQMIQWDENDVNVIVNFFAKRALKDFGLDQNTSIEMLSREEYDKRNRGKSHAVCVPHDDDTYTLEYSPDVKDMLLSKNIHQMLRGFQVVFHEIVHSLQNTTMKKEGVKSPETYLMAMETIARKQAPEIYDANYAHLLKENHAEKLGLDIALFHIKQFAPDLYKRYDPKEIEAQKKQYDDRYYEGKIDLFGKSRRGTAQIDKACSCYVAQHPETLKRFPVLQLGFNLDGTKKTLQQLLEERQQFIDEGKPIDKVNELYTTLANYKNYVKGTPGGTKEELYFLCDYIRETGTDDEFIYELMGYRLKNTTMKPSEIEGFIQRERNTAAKIRAERGEQEIKHEQEESIKDEVGDEFKPETEAQQQEQQQVETMWQNRFQSWDRKSITLPNADKKKEEAVQAMQDVEIGHAQEEKLTQQQLEEQRG